MSERQGFVGGFCRFPSTRVYWSHALMEHVLRIRKSRHPAAVAKHGVPAAMIDVQVCAKHIVDLIEGEPGVAESVEPRLLWKVPRRCIALVFARAGVPQDRVFRRAYDVCP